MLFLFRNEYFSIFINYMIEETAGKYLETKGDRELCSEDRDLDVTQIKFLGSVQWEHGSYMADKP